MIVTPVEHLLATLRQVLEVPIATLVQRETPDLFVRLDVTSTKATSPVSQDTDIAIQVYGVDQEETINLATALRFMMMDEIYAVSYTHLTLPTKA